MKKFGMRSLLAISALTMGLFSASASMAEGKNEISFRDDVFPIMQYRCLECHSNGGPGVVYSGLNMQSHEGLMRGTRHGPVIIAGKPMLSNLLVLVEGKAGIRMPHNRRRLTKCEIDILRRWIQQGAKNN
uniref:Cytochrome C Planctomycete-type domain-containing protein n=1 Tax=Magnetococcus massalia (strain MO-1) TaxID=451514 RepID=A0A1S7LLY2_MAGMO|nr:Conserved exported protein of unknown function [Candidatus Magnetococcus massalia]